MRVRFWGVRGSIPWATADTIGHGCNTPCIELVDETSGASLVLDAGSGVVGLGKTIDHRGIVMLLTHYHWDHVQGLPFFEPFYRAGTSATVWGPSLPSYDAAWLETVFGSPFFPIPHDRLPAIPAVRRIECGHTPLGPFNVRAMQLNHPGGAFAYRISGPGGDLVYATDHEHGDSGIDERLIAFSAGARAAVFDAHFTPEEAPHYRGWGHSSWLEAARDAADAGVERLFLFHHKPGRSDSDLDAIAKDARKVFARTDAAKEGATCEL
jgi:phosphoribosyl 1,2-cyclic phosphodiesterase